MTEFKAGDKVIGVDETDIIIYTGVVHWVDEDNKELYVLRDDKRRGGGILVQGYGNSWLCFRNKTGWGYSCSSGYLKHKIFQDKIIALKKELMQK